MEMQDERFLRYDRQMRVEGFGREGQLKLRRACVVVIGLGGLGCPSATYLAMAGVGKLKLVDKGEVDLSDLNRQILYGPEDLGKPKARVAAEKLGSLNPDVDVEALEVELDEDSLPEVLKGADVVLDGLDNWRTRFLVNEACVEAGIPFIHAGIRSFYGQMTTVMPGRGPCLRCILRTTPPEEGVVPVLGPTPGVMGSLQALEAIKVLTGLGEPLVGRLLIFDGLKMKFEEVRVDRNPGCPVCGHIGGR